MQQEADEDPRPTWLCDCPYISMTVVAAFRRGGRSHMNMLKGGCSGSFSFGSHWDLISSFLKKCLIFLDSLLSHCTKIQGFEAFSSCPKISVEMKYL